MHLGLAALFGCMIAAPSNASATGAAGVDSISNAWFQSHVFPGAGGCLEVASGQSLEQGDTVQIFEVGEPVTTRRIEYLINNRQAEQVFKKRGFEGVYGDSVQWDSLGCYWWLRADSQLWLARIRETPTQDVHLPLAIKNVPAGTLTIGGDRKAFTSKELQLLKEKLAKAVPAEFQRGKVLQVGWRYSGRGNELSEILLGKPFGATPYDSIQICMLFVQQGRVLTSSRFSRVTGVEERVDTEAPTLDERSWSEIQDETMGFLSLDQGVTWNRLIVNVGFEGIDWDIEALSPNLPSLWGHYLYTSH
jgi:hypothetical protein